MILVQKNPMCYNWEKGVSMKTDITKQMEMVLYRTEEEFLRNI